MPLVGLWNRGPARRLRAARLLGRTISGRLDAQPLHRAEVVLLCVADRAIAEVAGRLAHLALREDTIVAHCSGALPSAALGTGARAHLASLHPLIACPDPETGRRRLRRALFVAEGSRGAMPGLRRLVAALGGRMAIVSPAAKERYHAAAAMASNLVVTLLHLAGSEAHQAGLKDSTRELARLCAGAVADVVRLGAVRALTGPIARGDVATVQAHLGALGPRAAPAYRLLSAAALALARGRIRGPRAARHIRDILRGAPQRNTGRKANRGERAYRRTVLTVL